MIRIEIDTDKSEKYFEEILNVIKSQLNSVLTKGIYHIVKGKRKNYRLDADLKSYLKDLNNPTKDDLKDLITASPQDLIVLINKIKNDNPSFVNPSHDSYKVLYQLFISRIYDKNDRFSKTKFISSVDIDTCPYCNRNYIYKLSKKNGIKPEIDHFFPKSKYPFLGLSYYNLIPSCPTCNGINAKHDKDPLDPNNKLTNPYLLSYDDFEFDYKPLSVGVLNKSNTKKSVKVTLKSKHKGHDETFKLRELYELHSDHIIDLLIKQKMKYPISYINQLNNIKGLQFFQADINRAILGNYTEEKDIHKRPLAKLYQDIGKKIGLI